MAHSSTIPKGTVLSGKYRVGRELGRGGMASVYQAANLSIGKRVAIKLLAGHLAASQTVVERFVREARAVSKISSPHICDVYDSGRLEDGTPFLVMELLEGESLYDAMCRDRQMSPKLTLSIILQVGRGLAKAHEAMIVHRDLKPENIFLTVDDDDQLLVKILDFGLAKFYDPIETGKGKHVRLTREGAVFGTPAYMSPEQVRGQAAADTRADLWALACITYECFTGTTVWSTDEGVAMTFAQIATAQLPDPREYRPDLPPSFVAWFRRALDRDIDQRFQTVGDFADGLAGAFDYRSRGGGLDATLVTRITHEASGQSGLTSRPPPAASYPEPAARSSASPQPVELAPQLHDSEVMPRRRGSFGKFLVAALLLGGVGAAVAVAATEKPVAPTPEAKRLAEVVARLASANPPDEQPDGFKIVAKHPWLPRVRESQAMIAQGNFDGARKVLKRVYEESKHPLALNLMEQLKVANAAKTGGARCQVKGYARPGRGDLLSQGKRTSDASSPFIVRGIDGAVMTWTDTHQGQRRGFAVALDDELRNRALPLDITPEGSRVLYPQLIPVAQRYFAIYSDTTPGAPSVYMRWLKSDGVIAATPVKVGQSRGLASMPAATRLDDGRFVIAWADQVEADSIDLFFRVFDEKGVASAEAVRVTDYLNRGPQASMVRDVRVAAAGDKLFLAYAFQRGGLMQIRFLTVAVDTKPPGLEPMPPGQPLRERIIGNEMSLTPTNVKATAPSLACTKQGCFVAWQQTVRSGTAVAYIDSASGKKQWHKRFSATGRNPSISTSPSGATIIVWLDGGKVTTGSLEPSGVGPQSRIARTVWENSPPHVTPGAKSGDWYVAWLDYENGRRQPYAARIQCQ